MVSRVLPTIISDTYTVSISKEGNVYSFGNDSYGGHGHEEENVSIPTIIPCLENICSVSFGLHHTICLSIEGCVFSFGSNDCGQLGLGKDGEALLFTCEPEIVDLPPITQISCGNYFVICLSKDGDLYSFGSNDSGELGLGDNEEYTSPQLISSLKDIDFFECGGVHTFCKTINNELYCWGSNKHGELGLGSKKNKNTPTLCTGCPDNIVDIKSGGFHTLILTSTQEVYSCGYNYNGQLGRLTTDNWSARFHKSEDLSEVIRIECGYFHSICIDVYQNLIMFGYNKYGQLGLGDTDDRTIPTKHPSLSNIIDVSAKGQQTFIKTVSNEIYAFGNNTCLQLGIETEQENQLTPIRVFEDNEDIWYSNINKSKAKSARK